MKQIKQTFRQSLALLVFSILSLQAVRASSAAVFPAASSDQAWQDLQNKIASLNATSAPEDLVATEANVVTYQSAVALGRNMNWQGGSAESCFSISRGSH